MLIKSLQFTVRNLRGITRLVNHETFSNVQTKHYARFAPRHSTIVNEDELFDVNVYDTPKQPKKIKSRSTKSKAREYQQELAKLEKETFSENTDGGYDLYNNTKFEPDDVENTESDLPKHDSNKAKVKKPQSKKKITPQIQEEGTVGDQKLIYTKLEENDKLVSAIIMNLKSKKGRKKKQQILLEGTRFIKDAFEAGIKPETIIFSRWEDVKAMDIPFDDIKFYKVPYRSIQLYSTLTTSPGIMGIFDQPKPLKKSKSCLPITIICDNIRDPGNMGSILRAAAGVGCEKVVLTKGCVDFWDFKVLRSAAGAHFRVPIYGAQEWTDIRSLIDRDINVYVADNNAENLNEETNEIEEYSEEAMNDNEASVDDEAKSRKSKKSIRRIPLKNAYDLPLIPYYAVDYTKKEVVLIVGGETEGISKESYDLVKNYNGIRVNIPLDNKIDSLNAGMAVGVVAFEIKRQFLRIQQKLKESPV